MPLNDKWKEIGTAIQWLVRSLLSWIIFVIMLHRLLPISWMDALLYEFAVESVICSGVYLGMKAYTHYQDNAD